MPVGELGLVITGDITNVYYSDCKSYLINKVRVSDYNFLKSTVETMTDDNKKANHYVTDYCELFVKAKKISQVWVKKIAKDKNLNIAKLLAIKLNATLIVI